MSKRDYYEILAVEKTVDEDGLKKAYRRLAIQYHPDRNPGDKKAEELFKEVNEAYQILSDAKKRAQYDRFGHAGMGGAGFGGFESGFSGSFTDIFDNIFGDMFGGGGGRSQGIDLRYNLELEFEEAAAGAEKKITFEKEFTCDTCVGSGAKPGTKPKVCKSCQGTGQVRFNQGFFTLARTCPQCAGRGSTITEHCSDCRGKGRIKKPHSVVVKVPAGIDSEQRLRLKAEGEIAEANGAPGDLYVIIHVKDHPFFKRENEHVILDLPITFAQAALGTDLEVPTLHGEAKIQVKPGTQTGETLRLKGKGIKRLNGSGFGDEFIRITVEVPKHLSSKQKELLRQFEKEDRPECHPGITSFIEKFKEFLKD